MSSKTDSKGAIEAVFIRHGQSTANAGMWDQDFAQIALTELGWQQALRLAEQWTFTPGLIAVSPYLRARQTAEPTIARFPHVTVQVWDIYEFTHWDKQHWQGSSPEMEPEKVAKFFRVADPEFRRGSAETFAELLGRAQAALTRLETLRANAPVMLFSHGHFMQAVRQTVMFPQWTAEQKMLDFRDFDERSKVQNTQQIWVRFDGARWTID